MQHLQPSKTAPDITIGIDLGTTYSLAARMTPEGPKVLAGQRGGKLIPSVVAFDEQGRPVVGEAARQRQADNPRETIFSVKRLMGKGKAELGHALELYPYQVEEAQRGLVKVRVGEKAYTPQEISSFILKEVKARAEEALGVPVANAVITVPAYFDDAQRQATRDAGRIAGVEVLRIVNEPTAAALAYGMDRRPEGRIAVYDLGGGTFDLSILHVADGVFKVLATSGDTFLGGDDFDHRLVRRAAGEIRVRHGVDLLADHRALTQLKNAAERAKIALSTCEKTTFEAELGGSVGSFRMDVARAEFEAMTQPLMDRTLDACRAALADAKLTPAQIDEVILVGGSTRMFMVKPQVGAFFGRTPHSEIDPDEVVALGAAVQAHILTGGYREILLLDVIPLSLGLETIGGAVSKLILRNSPIPCTATEYFTTFVDNQTGIDFNIVQGERELAKDCRSLGKFKLSGIPPMPAGLPKVELRFIVDANGILSVSALEQTSGRAATVQVTPSHGLTDEEVERMIVDSIDKAEEDFAARKLVEARTEATRVIHATRKSLSEARALIAEEQAQKLERAVEELERAVEGDDADRVMSAMDEVNHLGMPLAEAMMNRVAQKILKDRRVADL